MGIKAQEMIDGCFAKAALDERIFVLRETDDLAPEIIREWAERFRQKHLAAGTDGRDLSKAILKHTEALELADAMELSGKGRLAD